MPRAPRVCGEPNCTVLVHDSKRKCAVHYKPFGGRGGTSSRTTTSDHRARRLRVLGRARYQCEVRYEGICLGRATDCDHIRPLSEGGSDTDWNSQAACRPCHSRKSSIEGRRAQL